MKQYLYFIFLFLCHASSSLSQTIDSIKIGNGGGFTGNASAYKISNQGIAKKSTLQPAKFGKPSKIKKSKYTKILKEAKTVLEQNEEFSKPFNTYKFVEIYSNGTSKKYTWGDPNFKTPVLIKRLYTDIMKTIATLNFNI